MVFERASLVAGPSHSSTVQTFMLMTIPMISRISSHEECSASASCRAGRSSEWTLWSLSRFGCGTDVCRGVPELTASLGLALPGGGRSSVEKGHLTCRSDCGLCALSSVEAGRGHGVFLGYLTCGGFEIRPGQAAG